MAGLDARVQRHLTPLVGLRLAIARLAADMRVLHFGEVRAGAGGTVGDIALHIQCPWRIEGPKGVVTGRSDLWTPSPAARTKPDFDWDKWTYDDGNLQDEKIARLLGGYDPITRSHVNLTGKLKVLAVLAERLGGASISLSGGFQLVIWPAGASGEHWRIFRPEARRHFVVE